MILNTDSYKTSHWVQYPPKTTTVHSYFEARVGGRYNAVMFFGLQYLLKKYLIGQVINQQMIDEAEVLIKKHIGVFNRSGWEHILHDHNGHLPITISAVPEGLIVPEGNVMMTVENTCPKCYWVTNYIETLLVQLWYPCTTGTISREMKKIILAALKQSGTDNDILFKLHDFGFRGSTSVESASIGGAAHLVNFMGTDTIVALKLLKDYYNIDMAGFSIPAAEHSTITSWGQTHELDAYRNMLTQFPTGLVAVVSDSWDIRNAICKHWANLKDQITSRDGLLVIRPDSGDPITLLPELLNLIGDTFGFITNSKGYRVLPSQLRMIQGDGIQYDTVGPILNAVMSSGWSADNLAFGSGGGLLQQCNRDTQRFAFKCSFVEVDGTGRNVYKQPATDPTKNSKQGRLMLTHGMNGLTTIPANSPGHTDIMRTVYHNGILFVDDNFDDIRKRAECYT